jgi:hypothetical protein
MKEIVWAYASIYIHVANGNVYKKPSTSLYYYFLQKMNKIASTREHVTERAALITDAEFLE